MLAYDYRAGSARLDDLPEIPISPHLYVLCDRCATSLRAPRGWILDDRRTPAPPPTARRHELVANGEPTAEVPAAVDLAESAAVEEPTVEPTEATVGDPPRPARDEGQRQLAFGYT